MKRRPDRPNGKRSSQSDDPRQPLLDAAATAQTSYWNALRELEAALDIDIEDTGGLELEGMTVVGILEMFGGTRDEKDT